MRGISAFKVYIEGKKIPGLASANDRWTWAAANAGAAAVLGNEERADMVAEAKPSSIAEEWQINVSLSAATWMTCLRD
jgi:hypothetical protein